MTLETIWESAQFVNNSFVVNAFSVEIISLFEERLGEKKEEHRTFRKLVPTYEFPVVMSHSHSQAFSSALLRKFLENESIYFEENLAESRELISRVVTARTCDASSQATKYIHTFGEHSFLANYHVNAANVKERKKRKKKKMDSFFNRPFYRLLLTTNTYLNCNGQRS